MAQSIENKNFEQPKTTSTGEPEELNEQEMEDVVGGTVINPQPLPPRHVQL